MARTVRPRYLATLRSAFGDGNSWLLFGASFSNTSPYHGNPTRSMHLWASGLLRPPPASRSSMYVGGAHKFAVLPCSCSFASESRKGGKGRVTKTSLPAAVGLSDKEAALQAALANIAVKFGKEAVVWLGQTTGPRHVPVISTGSLSLDFALGVGGLPKGRVVEIYGPEATGKTTLALHVIAESQKLGGKCVFLDVEHALDIAFAEAIGVRLPDLYIAQPDNGEEALDITDEFIRSGAADVVVIDSVAALAPKAELEGNMGDAHMALQARLMSQALRKLTHSLSRSQTLLIFINQVRSKLGSFGGFGGAPLEVTAGGNALKFYASVRLNIRKVGNLKRGEETIGSQVVVKVSKNKVASPFRTAEFEIEFGKGISRHGEILDFGVREGILGKSGSYFTYNATSFAHGRDNAKSYLREHPEFADELVAAIKEKMYGKAASGVEEVEKAYDISEEVEGQELQELDLELIESKAF